MTITKDEIGARLRARRKQRGWSLTKLTEQSGINNGSLSKIERGTQSVTSETLVRLCDAYGIEIDQLLAPVPADDAEIVQELAEEKQPRTIDFDPLTLDELLDTVELASVTKIVQRVIGSLSSADQNKVLRNLCAGVPRNTLAEQYDFVFVELKKPIHKSE